MRFTASNFLTHVKHLVTGGGADSAGNAKVDSGFLKDVTLPLTALSSAGTITDSSTGTASTTLAAGAGVQTLSFQHTFIGGTSAVEPVTNYTPGYKFKILSWSATTSVALVGGGGSRVANLEINATDVGTVVSTCTVAIAATTVGTVTAATAVSGANTGTASDTISIEIATGGTALTAGSVTFQIVIQNMDTADAIASLAAQNNSTGLEASETNLQVQSFAAGTTAAGKFSIVIPRDYDEATDTFAVKIAAAMAAGNDVPGLSITAYRKRPGSNIVTVASTVTGKLTGVTTAAALSSASQVLNFNLSGNGLRRDDAITVVVTADAHATDALLVYSVEPVYRSTLVSYHETSTGNPATGTALR